MTIEGRERAGLRIEQELNDRDWTQADLSERTGVNPDTISALVRGKTPRPRQKTTRRIEDEFDWERGTIRAMFDGATPPPRIVGQPGPNTRRAVFQLTAESDSFQQRRAAARLAMPDLSDDDFERIFALAERLRQPAQSPDPGLDDRRSQQQGGAV